MLCEKVLTSRSKIEPGFEDRTRGHEPRNAGSLQKLEKAREQILP